METMHNCDRCMTIVGIGQKVECACETEKTFLAKGRFICSTCGKNRPYHRIASYSYDRVNGRQYICKACLQVS